MLTQKKPTGLENGKLSENRDYNQPKNSKCCMDNHARKTKKHKKNPYVFDRLITISLLRAFVFNLILFDELIICYAFKII